MPHDAEQQGTAHVRPETISLDPHALLTDLQTAIQQTHGDVVVDLQHVVTLDAAALSVLVAAYNTLQEQGRRLELLRVAEDIRQLIQFLCLEQHFRVVAGQN